MKIPVVTRKPTSFCLKFAQDMLNCALVGINKEQAIKACASSLDNLIKHRSLRIKTHDSP